MTETSSEIPAGLPELNLSPEMSEVLGDLAQESGMDLSQLKLRARRVLKHFNDQALDPNH